MPRKHSSLHEKVGRWKVLAANLAPHLGELPHFVDMHGDLERFTLQAETLDALQENLLAQRMEATRKRQDVDRNGEALRARIDAALRSEHGFTSERLVEFGVKPLKARGRRTPPIPPEPPAPEPEPLPPGTE